MELCTSGIHGFTVGGYPEEMFLDLTLEESLSSQCAICYLISREPRECPLGHVFCTSCIVSWATGKSEASGKCPVCRTPGRYYRPSIRTRSWMGGKWVKCPDEGDMDSGCRWTGKVRDLNEHRQRKHDAGLNKHSRPPPILLFQKNKYALLNSQRRLEADGSLFDSNVRQLRGNMSGEGFAVARERNQQERHQRATSSDGGTPRSDVTNRRDMTSGRDVANASDLISESDTLNRRHSTTNEKPCVTQANQARVTLARHSQMTSRYRQKSTTGSIQSPGSNKGIEDEMLQDVNDIRNQLSEVSASLSIMVHQMRQDQERYTSYIRHQPVSLSPRLSPGTSASMITRSSSL